MKSDETVRRGGGNIFADLNLPDAEELNAKAQIAYRICAILEERKLTQKTVAGLRARGLQRPGWRWRYPGPRGVCGLKKLEICR
jgi:predicted XRE-type DNA-binding protein